MYTRETEKKPATEENNSSNENENGETAREKKRGISGGLFEWKLNK